MKIQARELAAGLLIGAMMFTQVGSFAQQAGQQDSQQPGDDDAGAEDEPGAEQRGRAR